MSDIDNARMIERQRNALTRRDLIKGVIVGGVAVSSAGYLFRASTLVGSLFAARVKGCSPST